MNKRNKFIKLPMLRNFSRRFDRAAVQRQQGGLRLSSGVRRGRPALRTRHHLLGQEHDQSERYENGHQELHVLRFPTLGSRA